MERRGSDFALIDDGPNDLFSPSDLEPDSVEVAWKEDVYVTLAYLYAIEGTIVLHIALWML